MEEVDGSRALVLELVEGPTLADRVAAGPLPVDEALSVAKQIAEALEAAHEHGIIHRDLKPANIKVRPDGTVKVLDFGLAKALDPTPPGHDLSQSPTMTSPAMSRVGVILGTAAYMAPEQARGKAVDKRADIWAFGCVLFEMCTGARAFGGDELTDTFAHIITKEPDWRTLPPDTPAGLRRLLVRCLKKDPKDRLHDMSDVRIEIADVLSGAPAPPTGDATVRPRPPWRRAAIPAATLVLGAMIAGVGARLTTHAPPVRVAHDYHDCRRGGIEFVPGR